MAQLISDLTQYPLLMNSLRGLSEDDRVGTTRTLCQIDLYFLLRYGCHRTDAEHPWIFDRCREVQASPNGHLDLWSRAHYKSSIITFALTLQDILNDPEITIGIFSHTRPIAKGFLRQIKRELEGNDLLKAIFPEILYADPKSQSPKWSEDEGIVVKRKSNPKESTVEAWGLVDGQPTSKHYKLLIYDDIVTRESVTTPEMIAKTTEALELSNNLGSSDAQVRYAGTRYHFNDSYSEIMRRGIVTPRVYPATVDGTMEGEPVLLTREELETKRRVQGIYTFSCLPGDAPILMGDFSEKTISEIKVGDEVVGFTFPLRSKMRMNRAKVKAITSIPGQIWEFVLASGRTVRCTPDHKWYTGRRGRDVGGTDSHLAYCTLFKGDNGKEMNHLVSFYDPRAIHAIFDPMQAGWLSGFFDGEGSISGKCIHFSQSVKWENIIPRLEKSLKDIGLEFSKAKTKHIGRNYEAYDFWLRGGRTGIMRFLNVCRPAKSERIIEALYERDSRNFNGNDTRDKIVSRRCVGEQPVFTMETTTGNYVAYGYVSKNCQMLLNPVADDAQGFKQDWMRYFTQNGEGRDMNKYILVDPANEKKKQSDYTSMFVVGLGRDENYYVLDIIRDRLNLTERADALFSLHKRWKPMRVGYERYGIMSDVQHIQDRMSRENYRFDIVELGGKLSKNDRIRRLIPLFETGRIFFPHTIYRTDYEKKTIELVQTFLEQEFKAFPVGLHDDMLDALSRLLDEDMFLTWPKLLDDQQDRYRRKIRTAGRGSFMSA